MYAVIVQKLSYFDSGKYCNRNTPKSHYSLLLTSGGSIAAKNSYCRQMVGSIGGHTSLLYRLVQLSFSIAT